MTPSVSPLSTRAPNERFLRAVQIGDIDGVRRLLPENDIDTLDEAGRSALAIATGLQPDRRIARFLLESGANPNLGCAGALEPVLVLARERWWDLVDLALAQGAEIPAGGELHLSLLALAAFSGPPRIVSTILAKTQWDEQRRRAQLALALRNVTSIEAVNALIAAGGRACIDLRDHNGDTPLARAVRTDRIDVCRGLLQHGADPNVRLGSGRTVTYIAAAWDRLEILAMLLQCGAHAQYGTGPKHDLIRLAAVRGGPLLELVREFSQRPAGRQA